MAAQMLDMRGKACLTVLGDSPLVAETPAHLLDDEVTPTARMFIRNNGRTPCITGDPDLWRLHIDGEVERPLETTLGELKRNHALVTLRLVLECGGNGRSFFAPTTKGNPWTVGGVSCAEWTGVRLADVLATARLRPSAIYTGHYGADPTIDGRTDVPSLSRGMRIEKALDPHTLIAFRLNGGAIPAVHGGPVRLIVPGWPGSLSAKWLTRIWIRDREHDGPGMGGFSYRVPRTPITPGSEGDVADMAIIESMPVRSIFTFPADGAVLPAGTRRIAVRGHAWAGDNDVISVDVSSDRGAHWSRAILHPPENRYAWQRFAAEVDLATAGHHEIWCKATDSRGNSQPILAMNWNPQGYGANPVHRLKVLVVR
jgi:DMSO/TMAO reductase YedYZ molybdopterin-dependent catalytic subunit